MNLEQIQVQRENFQKLIFIKDSEEQLRKAAFAVAMRSLQAFGPMRDALIALGTKPNLITSVEMLRGWASDRYCALILEKHKLDGTAENIDPARSIDAIEPNVPDSPTVQSASISNDAFSAYEASKPSLDVPANDNPNVTMPPPPDLAALWEDFTTKLRALFGKRN